jgi:hypothetical protein
MTQILPCPMIQTRYRGPTDTRASRVYATHLTTKRRVSVPWDHALDSLDNHLTAARKLLDAERGRVRVRDDHNLHQAELEVTTQQALETLAAAGLLTVTARHGHRTEYRVTRGAESLFPAPSAPKRRDIPRAPCAPAPSWSYQAQPIQHPPNLRLVR